MKKFFLIAAAIIFLNGSICAADGVNFAHGYH